MDLIERLKKIAEVEGIPESDLILDEARFFMREHRGHGCYDIQLFYDENSVLYSIDLKCRATQINVRQLNEREKDEGDIEAQRERREEILRGNSRHYEK
ncbi:MAG: hypothetical protein U1B79_00915 [Candidatus Pacearchaeota archaeon]|nr:hypothetical protein [Nanoarchaeota archaeon]MDZ4226651.1 hypothetical protein [Candidatus Pacearchaeota archaeon]